MYNNFVGSESVPRRFLDASLQSDLQPSIQLAEYKDGDYGQKILSLNEKALQLLKDIPKPVAVVSICGPYRSGKSYFLSQMLRTKDTFIASSKSDPCTLGIWMSTRVLECNEFVVVFVDTEGTNAAKGKLASKHGDVKKTIVFCTLISSYLIYNSPGAIKQEELENMRYSGMVIFTAINTSLNSQSQILIQGLVTCSIIIESIVIDSISREGTDTPYM